MSGAIRDQRQHLKRSLSNHCRHYLALGQLRLGQGLQRVEVALAHAGVQGPAGAAQRQLHGGHADLRQQLLATIGSLAGGWCVMMICRACFAVALAAGRATVQTSLMGVSLFCRSVRALTPSLTFLGFGFYAHRLMRSSLLRQEWRDSLPQLSSAWSWSRCRQASAADTTTACPICAEDVDTSPWYQVTLPCCSGVLCWACLRRHAESVIDDARPEMLCPLLPCRSVVPDTLISCAFRREQWSWQSLNPLGGLARRKQRAYERWCLSSGLAAACSARVEDVVHCPSGECSHMWLLPRELRRQKSKLEPASSWDPRSWSLGRHVGLYTPPTADGGKDQRYVHCPKCNGDYCLLCSHPWSCKGGHHQGKSCVEHDAAFPDGRHLRDRQWGGAKPCPGCSVRTIRSMGCNHMTCTQCAMHWCWVCRGAWQPRHYSCTAEISSAAEQCRLM